MRPLLRLSLLCFKIAHYALEQIPLPINALEFCLLCSTCKAWCSTIQHFLFFLSYFNYKIMNINSSSIQFSPQQLIYVLCKHFELHLQFESIHKITTADSKSHNPVISAFYTIFVNCSGNFYLLCWHYAQWFCFPIMLKIMLTYNRFKPSHYAHKREHYPFNSSHYFAYYAHSF